MYVTFVCLQKSKGIYKKGPMSERFLQEKQKILLIHEEVLERKEKILLIHFFIRCKL